ncbi:tetratricopeptide repeat protein [Streptomyces malaysiense]|uniref:Uncharacterized protein n=1 Tax=Streptomyces malaysiense TaxID=1428626 RepID=A0A1J4PR62_9ACTN|nr:hypothetical protein VT52_032740 [Streptomyces malaysiense]
MVASRACCQTAASECPASASHAARPQEALAVSQEAVVLARVAVERRGRVHEQVLATALGNLGCELFEAGRGEEARAALEEAVLVHRSVLSRQPGCEPQVITALSSVGFLYPPPRPMSPLSRVVWATSPSARGKPDDWTKHWRPGRSRPASVAAWQPAPPLPTWRSCRRSTRKWPGGWRVSGG